MTSTFSLRNSTAAISKRGARSRALPVSPEERPPWSRLKVTHFRGRGSGTVMVSGANAHLGVEVMEFARGHLRYRMQFQKSTDISKSHSHYGIPTRGEPGAPCVGRTRPSGTRGGP